MSEASRKSLRAVLCTSTHYHVFTREAMLLIALMLTLFPFAIPAYAALTTNAPFLLVHSGIAIRHVLEADDLLIFWRYSLPSDDWATFTVDGVLALFNDPSVGAPLQTRVPPNLDEGLGAFYLGAGHAFIWESTATVDFISNPALFVNNTSSSIPIQFITTATVALDSTADQTIICNQVRGLLIAIESASASDDFTATSLVTANSVTERGTTIATNAFGPIGFVVPDCLSVGVDRGGSFNPNAPLLRTSRTADVEATDAWARWDRLASEYGFEDEDLAAAFLGIATAGLAMVVSLVVVGSVMYGATVGALVLLAGAMNAPHFLLQGVFVVALFASLGAAAFWVRKMP